MTDRSSGWQPWWLEHKTAYSYLSGYPGSSEGAQVDPGTNL